MPVRDEDVERALRDTAPRVDTQNVLDRVAAKRARRRATHTARVAVLTVVAAIVTVGGVLLLARDDETARVTTPVAPASDAIPVALDPDEGYLRGPLVMSGDTVSVAAYDTDGRGGFDFPPSRIVRFDPDTFAVVDRVDLKAEILSVTDGADGVRWAITRNRAPAATFLKRIAADNTVRSTELPAGTEITGDVTIDGTNVQVPVRDGVLRFDLTGRFVAHLDIAVVEPSVGPPMPPGFTPRSRRSSGPRTWVEGTKNGVPAVVLVANGRVREVITLQDDTDASFAWIGDDTVLATSGGRLLRIRVDG